jgi:hypothetical protein
VPHKDPERALAYYREYNAKRSGTPANSLRNAKDNAIRRGLKWALADEQYATMWAMPCAYCGESPGRGVDRQDNDIGYVPSNCVPCCKICNRGKRAASMDRWKYYKAQLVRHFLYQNNLKAVSK